VIVGVRIFLTFPVSNGYCLVPLSGDKSDLVLKSLLLAEQGNDFLLKNTRKLRHTIALELDSDIPGVHLNLLVWFGEGAGIVRLPVEVPVTAR
jgi:hypothetical protein